MTLTSKPDWGTPVLDGLHLDSRFQAFFDELEQQLNASLLGQFLQLKVYTVASLPTGIAGAVAYVSDETGGAVPAFNDGTNWRRMTDRVVVS